MYLDFKRDIVNVLHKNFKSKLHWMEDYIFQRVERDGEIGINGEDKNLSVL